MKKLIFVSVFFLLIAAQTGSADVFFQPQFSTINVGDPITVDVMISNVVSPWLGAYDIHISYDPAILLLSAGSFDNFLSPSIRSVDFSTAGSAEVSEVSLASVADLGNAQSGNDPFRLFELIFGSALAPGVSPLTFGVVILTGGNGGSLASGNLLNGSVTVQVAAVSEPATMLLLSSGLIGLVGYGRKKLFKK
jgi:hypothetical protein